MRKKKSILILLFCCLNLTMLYKFFDAQSGLPAYKELHAKIEEIKNKIEHV
jgi:regulatory protein YycI of two-component signal transduction system YycFG